MTLTTKTNVIGQMGAQMHSLHFHRASKKTIKKINALRVSLCFFFPVLDLEMF